MRLIHFLYLFFIFFTLILAEENNNAKKEETEENIPPPKVYFTKSYEYSTKFYGYILTS